MVPCFNDNPSVLILDAVKINNWGFVIESIGSDNIYIGTLHACNHYIFVTMTDEMKSSEQLTILLEYIINTFSDVLDLNKIKKLKISFSDVNIDERLDETT